MFCSTVVFCFICIAFHCYVMSLLCLCAFVTLNKRLLTYLLTYIYMHAYIYTSFVTPCGSKIQYYTRAHRHIRHKKLLAFDLNHHVDFCCSSAAGILSEELLTKSRRSQLTTMTKRYCFGTRRQRYGRRSEAMVEGLDARCIPVDKLRGQVLAEAFDIRIMSGRPVISSTAALVDALRTCCKSSFIPIHSLRPRTTEDYSR